MLPRSDDLVVPGDYWVAIRTKCQPRTTGRRGATCLNVLAEHEATLTAMKYLGPIQWTLGHGMHRSNPSSTN